MVTQGFGEVAERLRRSTVQVHHRRGAGSGVIWSAGGVIVTNAHVIHDSRAKVSLWDGSARSWARLSESGRSTSPPTWSRQVVGSRSGIWKWLRM